eukprot:m.256077 g.256077  ORF g.256077 m.256077 type:complete len:155 (+) comp34044_c1_seq1:103-567(+)
MASGVSVSDAVVDLFEATKMGMSAKNGKPGKAKYFLCKIDREKGEIQLDSSCDDFSLVGEEGYQQFVEKLPPKEGRYALYDFDYTTLEGGVRNKLAFIVWCPDEAPIKEKMLYASSKDAIKKKFNGLHFEIQATDYDEVAWTDIYEKHTNSGRK